MKLFGFILLFPWQVWAATYYVALTGNDASPGNESQPWLTIQKAADAMSAGDTAIVMTGNYNERVTTKSNGTQENPVRFVANGTVTVGGFIVTKAWQEVHGFYLTGTNVTGYQGLIDLQAGGDSFLARSNTLSTLLSNLYLVRFDDPAPTNAVFEANRFLETVYQGVALAGSGHLLTNNYFSSTNGGDAIRVAASNTTITRSTFTNWSNLVGSANHTDLIQAFSTGGLQSTNVTIERNIFINCVETQIGNIEDQEQLGRIGWWTWRNNVWANVSAKMSIYAHDFYFYNNSFYRSGTNSGAPILFRESVDKGVAHNGKVFNNIFYECGSAGDGSFGVDGSPTNMQSGFNVVKSVVGGADPRFNNPPANLGLTFASPCIGAATNLNELFINDLNGVVRGGAWDVGAYEYVPGRLTFNNFQINTLIIGQ